ncbi:MAG: SDH family Clp fold serine proteinase [Burkholderiales bacterium]
MAVERAYSIWFTLANIARFLFWVLLLVLAVLTFTGRSNTKEPLRNQLLEQLQVERKARVIALIHRQESASILGVPVASYINIEDSEAVLRAIRLTPADQPIDMILHTPGGLVLAAEQIAKAVADRKAKVTVFIPHYAMSGGTLIALAADEIVMDANAVLGPVDPQIGDAPAASILKVLALKKPEDIDDQTIILADIATKARAQVATFVAQVLTKHFPADQATKLAIALSEGRWTHDFPITVQLARELGLPVTTNMPLLVYQLMDLYPQANTQRPSVVYVPTRTTPEKAQGQTPAAAPAK